MSITGGMFTPGGQQREDPDDDRGSGGEGPDRTASSWELIDIDLDQSVVVVPGAQESAEGDEDAGPDVDPEELPPSP